MSIYGLKYYTITAHGEQRPRIVTTCGDDVKICYLQAYIIYQMVHSHGLDPELHDVPHYGDRAAHMGYAVA